MENGKNSKADSKDQDGGMLYTQLRKLITIVVSIQSLTIVLC